MNGRVALLVTFRKAKPKSQSLSRSHIRDLNAIKMNSMKTTPTQVFLVSVLLWSVFFFFINEILVLHSSLAALKEKIADGFTYKIIVYILGGFLMAYISRYIKRRENTAKINK
jgi:dolichyl-phosphate-mannose--protein O-mannosyl transferase